MAVDAAALTLADVSCRFGPRLVVDRVSFAAPAGQVTVLVGPSGCGKTTLLRLIAGVERLSGGRIAIDGREVAGAALHVPPERRQVGLMFQDYALFPHLSALDNVLFGLGGVPRAARSGVAEAALGRVGLGGFAGRYPDRLSGGEQQRLALARALAPSPRILLMDEPFSNLDRSLRDDVRAATLAVLREAGITTLVVTHDPEEALAVGDHLVLLAGGRVLQAGAAGDVYARPACLAAARALSHVNLVPGRFEGTTLRTPLGPIAGGEGREGEAAIAGFRPEHLSLVAPGAGVRGRIESRSFRGGSTLVTVAVDGLEAPLRVLAGHAAPSVGEEVGIQADPAAAFVVTADA